jgi:hypothetical protein
MTVHFDASKVGASITIRQPLSKQDCAGHRLNVRYREGKDSKAEKQKHF